MNLQVSKSYGKNTILYGGVADFFNTYEYMYEMLPDNVEVLNDAGKTNVIGAYKILEEEINSMMEMV